MKKQWKNITQTKAQVMIFIIFFSSEKNLHETIANQKNKVLKTTKKRKINPLTINRDNVECTTLVFHQIDQNVVVIAAAVVFQFHSKHRPIH